MRKEGIRKRILMVTPLPPGIVDLRVSSSLLVDNLRHNGFEADTSIFKGYGHIFPYMPFYALFHKCS